VRTFQTSCLENCVWNSLGSPRCICDTVWSKLGPYLPSVSGEASRPLNSAAQNFKTRCNPRYPLHPDRRVCCQSEVGGRKENSIRAGIPILLVHVWGSYGGKDGDALILCRNALWDRRKVPTFRRNTVFIFNPEELQSTFVQTDAIKAHTYFVNTVRMFWWNFNFVYWLTKKSLGFPGTYTFFLDVFKIKVVIIRNVTAEKACSVSMLKTHFTQLTVHTV
jgi:hypothetical protein